MSEHIPFHPRVQAVIAAIRQLSPENRRRLQRRLRVSGLWVQDELVTDQNRLQIAPALGKKVDHWRRAVGSAAPPQHTQPVPAAAAPASSTNVSVSASTPANPAADPQEQATPADYRSAVRSKVVVGAPGDTPAADPHVMSPLPGQAPEQPIVIIFDGGSKGNPGRGYGSYALRWPGQPQQVVQLQFGERVTNNEAEYDTLIAALEAVEKRLADLHAEAKTATLHIFGDSLLVVNQVNGVWECKEPRMRTRRDQAQRLLARFGHFSLKHHDRSKSVEVLGH